MERMELEAQRLLASDVLERSPQLAELFTYLVHASARNRSPKEAEIAQDVFGRDASFEPAQDALVRVHVHRLRGKIDRFYADHPSPDSLRLTIPRGEYRLVLSSAGSAEEGPPTPDHASRRTWLTASLLVAAVAVGIIAGRLMPSSQPTEPVPSQLWNSYHRDSRTALIIVGDHHGDGETGLPGSAGVATPGPGAPAYVVPSATTILPVGVATALRHVIPALASGDPSRQRMRLLPMSQVTPDMMRAANIVYIGHLADIAMIGEPLFAGSKVRPAARGRALADAATGRILARAPDEKDDLQRQSDFGYVASFSGPSNNRITVIAGGGNAGLMQAAEMAASPDRIQSIMKAAGPGEDFEAVLVVTSLHDMNMGSRLILTAPLDSGAIWREGKSD